MQRVGSWLQLPEHSFALISPDPSGLGGSGETRWGVAYGSVLLGPEEARLLISGQGALQDIAPILGYPQAL